MIRDVEATTMRDGIAAAAVMSESTDEETTSKALQMSVKMK
jgi:hypothetical protein